MADELSSLKEKPLPEFILCRVASKGKNRKSARVEQSPEHSIADTAGANLVITSTKSDHKVTLPVNQPLASPSPPKLTVSYHERNWTPEYDLPPSKVWTLQPGLKHEHSTDILPTLGNRIIDDEVKWGKDIDFEGEFIYTPGYWEWAEDELNFFWKPLREGMIYEAVFASLFTYDRNVDIVQAFCEAWCLRTNTLITSSGEMSISLRDLYMLGGLPLLGYTYDERIPNALDLAKGSHKCCACLFKALFHLTQQECHNTYVQASRWIDFWCRKTRKYAAPPPRKDNKKSRPKATHNPSGILEAAPRWSHVSEAPFVELNIPQNLEQEVYLAAFLACWLCTFVLPGNPTATIRPETFNMVCKMAKGIKVCLAPPVLASIYYGLNSISESISPGQMGTPFPIHYVYGWLSAYFNTHIKTPSLMSSSPKMVTSSGEGGAKYYDKIDARKRIFKGECVSWLCTSRQNGRLLFCDDKRGGKENFEYFICLRPGFLVLRQGRQCKVEPYVPHRFNRQFGFYQASAPGLLLTDDCDVTHAEGFKLHRQYEHFNSLSRATFPMNPTIPKKHVLDNYKAWLVDVYANLLENRVKDIVINGDPNVTVREGINQEQRDQLNTLRKGKAPVQDAPNDQVSEHASQKIRDEQVRHRSSDEDVDSDRNFKRNRRLSNEGSAGLHVSNDAGSSNQHSSIGEVEHSDSSESLNQVVASHQSLPPSNPPHQEAQPEPSHVSILPGADSFMSRYMAMIACIWNDICEKLKETPAESVSSFKGSVERQLQLMKHNGVDLSSLENRVDVFFKKAQDYDKIRSKHSEAMPVETQVAELCLAQSTLKDAKQKLSETQTLLSEKQKILEDFDGQITLLEEAIKEAEKTIKEAEKRTAQHITRGCEFCRRNSETHSGDPHVDK
nr:ABC transporter G family member 11 [Ipomoea batatas]